MKGVELWVFSLTAAVGDPCLSPGEERRAAAIGDDTRRHYYERSRSLMRRVLARRLSVTPEEVIVETAPAGKPRLLNRGNLGFSISHSGEWFVVAVGEGELGVDIEIHLPRMDPLRLARRYFSGRDFSILRAAHESMRKEMFRHQWVAKEAAVKAAGTGLANILGQAECEYKNDVVEAVHWADERFAIGHFQLDDGPPGAIARPGDGAIKIVTKSVADLDVS